MHELGHLLGYEHSEDGLMAPVLSASSSRIPDLGSHPDGVFADMEWDSSAEPSSVLLASHDGEVPKTAAVKSSDERTHVRAPRPSRLQRYERELDDWFTQLAAAERVNL